MQEIHVASVPIADRVPRRLLLNSDTKWILIPKWYMHGAFAGGRSLPPFWLATADA